MTTGLTSTGLIVPTLEEILTEIKSQQLASSAIGPNVDQSETSALGQLNGIMANQIRIAWEALDGVYNGLNPDSNGGTVQDNVAAITGTTRLAATASRTVHTATLAAGTYAAGTLVIRPVGTTTRSANLEEIISPGGAVAGVIFEALTVGETAYTTATTWEIASPVVGFTVISVASGITNGTNVEADDDLRLRRELEAQGGSGSTTTDAIRAAILSNATLGAVTATVYENVTGVVDANGVEPYSVEAVVFGPTSPTAEDDQALAEVIYAAKAGGIRASGTQDELVVDSQGLEHVIGFSRPVEVAVKSEWTLRVQTGVFNLAAAKEAISLYAPMSPGEELQWTQFICAGRVTGVLDVVSMTMAKTTDTLGTANITPTVREYITMNVSDINLIIT